MSQPLWRCHTPNLLREVLSNQSAAVLRQPLNIFGHLLALVATRASEIDDPQLNTLMLRLTLYEQGDPEKHSSAEVTAAIDGQLARVK